MGVLQLSAVGLVLLLGLVGVLLPGLPGLLLCWAGVMWWALSIRSTAAWAVLIGATAVLLLSQVLRLVLPGERILHRDPRAPWRVLLAAGLGGLLGFCLVPVLGCLPGMYCGVFLLELVRLRDVGNARLAARTARRSIGTAVYIEYFAALLVCAAWLFVVLFR
jgi:uncharacterized protein YqgC (DUF456 family)